MIRPGGNPYSSPQRPQGGDGGRAFLEVGAAHPIQYRFASVSVLQVCDTRQRDRDLSTNYSSQRPIGRGEPQDLQGVLKLCARRFQDRLPDLLPQRPSAAAMAT